MKHIYSFERLAAWQDVRQFVKETYHITSDFPQKEKFGLSSQIRRAGVSVSSIIAEGSSNKSHKEQSHF